MLKRNRRILAAFLAILLMAIYFFSVPAFATNPTFDIQDYTITDLQKMSISEKKELLANYISTYNPYGIQELLEEAEKKTNGTEPEISPYWASDSNLIESGQQMATHQLITLEALSVFISDFGFYQTDATTALVVALNLAAASGLPDLDEDDLNSYKGHFYDLDSGENYLFQTSPTAKTRTGEHYANATSKLRTNVYMDLMGEDFTYVLEELGRALHYMQDVCEPHHASNQVGVLTSHIEFEAHIDNNIDKLLPSVSTVSKGFYRNADNESSQNLVHQAAVIGKLYVSDAGRLDTTKWNSVGTSCLENAIWHSARLIYKIFADNDLPFTR